MTSTHIAKIRIAPDDGSGLSSLDYNVIPNNIGLHLQIPRVNMWDVSFKHVVILEPDEAQIIQINVYVQRPDFEDRSFHSIRSHNSFIGTINPKTLENTGVVLDTGAGVLLPGGVEYLAPDIAIHRPDLHMQTQYITLLAAPATNLSAIQEPCPEQANQRFIQLNIHKYEHKKEQRRLYTRYWNDDGRFFTLICSKWLDKQWLIYQVDRLNQTIAFMRIQAPANSTLTEIQPGGKIIISEFDLLREIVRVIEPTKTDISSVLTGIPFTAAEFIAKFTEQNKINY
jgi:hypothetical protein